MLIGQEQLRVETNEKSVEIFNKEKLDFEKKVNKEISSK